MKNSAKVRDSEILSVDRRTQSEMLPEYSDGRFFISPVLGCSAHCSYCYIYSEGFGSNVCKNPLSIGRLISWLESHERFRLGRKGSILSVGAWGDPFAPEVSVEVTLELIRQLSALGNPIQLITKYPITEDVLDALAKVSLYRGHLLFSTSIVSITNWQSIDPKVSSPENRLKMLARMENRQIPTNLMIKPFLRGITDIDTVIFKRELMLNRVTSCVVGVLYWNAKIAERIYGSTHDHNTFTKMLRNRILDHGLVCRPASIYRTFSGEAMDGFCAELMDAGIRVFKNASCVSAWLTDTRHVSGLRQSDPLGLCVNCENAACQ